MKAIEVNPGLASEARRDDDFQGLSADPEFIAMTQAEKE